MGYTPDTDYVVADDLDGNGPYFVQWNHGDPQPTEQEATAAYDAMVAADLAADPARRWAALRHSRDEVLRLSDWTQLPDAPLTAPQVTAYQTWRQDLRDLPQDYPVLEDAEAQLPILIAAEPTV